MGYINPFVPNTIFLYPLKTSEDRKVFWCFQRVEKGCIENKWVNWSDISVFGSCGTAQKMKFSIKDFFSKCDQIRRKLQIWSYLLKKSLMKILFFLLCGYNSLGEKCPNREFFQKLWIWTIFHLISTRWNTVFSKIVKRWLKSFLQLMY